MDFKSIFKKILPHLIAVAAMFMVSSVYFFPAWEGKSLQGEDVVGGYGKEREKRDFQKYENESVIWNGVIFSGMPDFIGVQYKGATQLKKLFQLPSRLGVPREVNSVFWYMIGFYILLISLGVSPKLSAGGSIAFALTSYYIIIILAGHYMKVWTLALVPPTLAGVLLCFNRKYTWGFILTAFFLALQISMAHIQMIYYFLIALIFIGAVELFYQIKENTWKQFMKTMAVVIAAALLAIAPNASRLINYYKYNDESIRGSSELTIGNEEVKTKDGLDKDYINSWSSGVSESMMIVVPNVKGGMTGQIGQDRDLLNKVPRQYRNVIGNFNKYWGNQPFSGGPNYLGAVFVLLFLIGVFTIKGRFKWAMVLPVILFYFLSLGGNFSTFTDLFIYYVPLYNKFRAPVSILAVSAILLSLFAVYTLYRIKQSPELLVKKAKLSVFKKPKPVYMIVSAGLLIFLLLNIAFPELFNSYISDAEKAQFSSLRNQPNVANQLDGIIAALKEFRIGVFRADLWRTFLFVALVTGLLFLYSKKKIKPTILVMSIIVLAIIDFWAVSRRYVPLEQFSRRSLVEEAYQLSDVDKQIYEHQLNTVPGLEEKLNEAQERFEPENEEEENRLTTYVINKHSHYRVFNTTQSPFQENVTSSAHRSVGGYHAVKLRRYQDMIEHHLSNMNREVLDMLNTKYIITANGLQINRDALGAGWFVDSIKWVDNSNDEILALNDINTSTTAVLREDRIDNFPSFSKTDVGEEANISLEEYSPDNLIYSVKTPEDKLVVFSEVYYPDWEVYIDGQKSEIYRANYILRAVVVPEGEHKVEFKFHPNYYYTSNTFSKYAFYVLVLALILAIGKELYQAISKPHQRKENAGKA